MLFLMVDFVALEPSVSDLLTLLGLEPGDYSEKKKEPLRLVILYRSQNISAFLELNGY